MTVISIQKMILSKDKTPFIKTLVVHLLSGSWMPGFMKNLKRMKNLEMIFGMTVGSAGSQAIITLSGSIHTIGAWVGMAFITTVTSFLTAYFIKKVFKTK